MTKARVYDEADNALSDGCESLLLACLIQSQESSRKSRAWKAVSSLILLGSYSSTGQLQSGARVMA